MTLLPLIMLAASFAVTWGLVRLLRRLWERVSGAWGDKCPHHDWFGVCSHCAYERRDAEARAAARRDLDEQRQIITGLPGAAEGGSTYVHRDDDFFDERPTHPDRPDEDH